MPPLHAVEVFLVHIKNATAGDPWRWAILMASEPSCQTPNQAYEAVDLLAPV